ncbi:MAG: site-specific integrase [Rhodospirillaceae bacterium]|nr:site-specific integrase [Rhodospirillaceae bacterium]
MTPLRRRMAEDMQVRNISPCTQNTYIRQVSLFAHHFGKSPELLGPEQVREYQVHPATEKRLAPGSIGVAVAALRFLYGVTLHKDWNIPEVLPTPKQPAKLPVVPSPEEVVSFLDAVPILRNRVVLTTCYAAGLRISEAVSLRPTDIDSRRMVVRVEQGKGGKDRYVMLSPRLLETLRDYWRRARPAGERLFPGRYVTRNAPQRACRKAHRAAGLSKRITPRSLRHDAESRIIPSRLPKMGGARALRDIGLGIITGRSGMPEPRLRGGIAPEACPQGWFEPSPVP